MDPWLRPRPPALLVPSSPEGDPVSKMLSYITISFPLGKLVALTPDSFTHQLSGQISWFQLDPNSVTD